MAKHNGFSEDELCLAFAECVKESDTFRQWMLRRTKFGGYAKVARLLSDDQLSIRPRKYWWRHWWSFVPELNRERETDVFMVFEIANAERFALHVEVKLGTSRFEQDQASGYGPAARHMANKPEYLSYSDYQTILICTESFRESYPGDAALFDLAFTFDELASHISHFREQEA